MATSDNLRRVKPGDQPSASQQNIMVQRHKALARSSGPGMMVLGDGTIVMRPVMPDEGAAPQRLRVRVAENDYLKCRSWDGTTEGDVDILVAKPFKLRHVAANYPNVSAIVTVDANSLTATISGEDEDWVLPDEQTYTDDDEIYAIPVETTGVTVDDVELTLLDSNVDARAWTK